MTWCFAALAVLALAAVAMVASGYGRPMSRVYDDRPDVELPADRPLGPGDLRRVRFSTAFRGYRMSEVDTLLARMAAQMEAARAAETPPDRAVDAPHDTPDRGGPEPR